MDFRALLERARAFLVSAYRQASQAFRKPVPTPNQPETKSAPLRLYLVTRQDLPPGQQAVQAAHALREFTAQHRELDDHWYKTSNTLAFLAVKDEEALHGLLEKARGKGLAAAPFREPDRDNELTAVAFEPGCKRILSQVPLALRCITPA